MNNKNKKVTFSKNLTMNDKKISRTLTPYYRKTSSIKSILKTVKTVKNRPLKNKQTIKNRYNV